MSDKQPSSSGPDIPATALLDALRFLSNDLYAACREYGHIASCASPEYRAVCEARACTLSVIAGSIKKTVDHITSNKVLTGTEPAAGSGYGGANGSPGGSR